MPGHDATPVWNTIAGKFDFWLPRLVPAGDALLDVLAPQPNTRVLDIACGTGEPILSLARRPSPPRTMFGVDVSTNMLSVARAKTDAEGLSGLTFCASRAERLCFPDQAFDAVMSRFGLMMFDDPLRGMHEMGRVLMPGGRIALCVWGRPEHMSTLYWAYHAFQGRIADSALPHLSRATRLGRPGILNGLLDAVAIGSHTIRSCDLAMTFVSFDDYWTAVERSHLLERSFAHLDPDERHAVRSAVRALVGDAATDTPFVVHHEYLLAVIDKR